MKTRYRRFLLFALLFGATSILVAQGPPGQDRDNPPPGHGGMPPGQAKKHDHMPPGQAKKYGDDRGLPPGQAKKYFRDEDRDHYYGYYRQDADRWRYRRRPVFVVGESIPTGVIVRIMPQSYWVGVAPPPPPGYRYGYCGGYVVAYNPATRVVADVLDLVGALRSR
jgi:hypothetical protein